MKVRGTSIATKALCNTKSIECSTLEPLLTDYRNLSILYEQNMSQNNVAKLNILRYVFINNQWQNVRKVSNYYN